MRRIRLMHSLGWFDEGSRIVEDFKKLFPEEKEFSDKMHRELGKASALASEETHATYSIICSYKYLMYTCTYMYAFTCTVYIHGL